MLRKLFSLTTVSLIAMNSVTAATLFIPGVAGIPDQQGNTFVQSTGCITNVPAGSMEIGVIGFGNPNCVMAYPISLPVGSTIDSVEIEYYNNYGGPAQPSIAAYLAENRLKPPLGAIAVGGANAHGPPQGYDYLYMPALSVQVVTGYTYWVQVVTSFISEVGYVSVTYH